MRSRPRSRAVLLALALAVPALAGPAAAQATEAELGAPARVIVTGSGAADAVTAVDGQVTRELPIVDGVAATVPADRLAALTDAAGVRTVTPDGRVTVQGSSGPSTSSVNHVLAREVGADQLRDRGLTGAGIRVALIDTGVADEVQQPGADLHGRVVPVRDPHTDSGALVPCVDLSGEQSCDDSYGHGTFMAGLIAGNGARSGGAYPGVAPGADVVSIKIAGRDGSADVSKVLAAIQWVVSFREEYGIRVLNLSLGTDSRASWKTDPLNFAVQRAWRSGIVVVVSAGYRGPEAGTISKPADDPMVLTVGAVDDRETPATSDDRLPRFSARGPAFAGHPTLQHAKPDVVAPGGRVVGLRAPGSTIESAAPGGGVDGVYRRGSGTSMSAAVVSGLTALLLEADGRDGLVDLTPDRLKAALMTTAVKVAADDPLAVGRGLVHGPSALAATGLPAEGTTVPSDATGALQDTRGTVRVVGRCLTGPCVITGDETSQGRVLNDFDAAAYRGDWTGSSWYSSQWTSPFGSSWYANSWADPAAWQGSSWYGSSWYGSTDSTFYGTSLQGSSWYGAWS